MENGWNNYESDNENNEQDYAFQTLDRHGKPKTVGWSVASLVMGAVSLFTCSFGWASIIFGALAIVFAVASRRILGYFDGKSIFGLILGLFGTVFGLGIIIYVYTIGEEDQKYLWQIIKQMYENSSGTGSDI
ncbi:MAG: hypothetical protein E7612_03710 [Ruminococcaceae bacterium]|nr:hypothetical protein [Oscillospiraceae bacterium]